MKLGAFLSLVLTAVAGVTCHPRGSPHPPAVCLPKQWSGALVLDTSSCSTEQLMWNINLVDSVAVDYEAMPLRPQPDVGERRDHSRHGEAVYVEH